MTSRITLPMAIIIGINAMVGAGIFTVPSALQATVGPVGLLAYFFVIIAVIFMALSLARVSQLFPQEGAFYTYAQAWAGHTGGLIASGLYIAGLLVAMGLLTKITSNYIHVYFPVLSSTTIGIALIAALLALNMAGAVLSQIGQVILFILTLVPLLVITLLCFSQASISHLTPFAPYGFGQVFTALKAVVFGFFGFEAIPSLFVLLDNPRKTVPRAIIYSIVLVGIIYFTFVSSIFLALPRELFPTSDTALASVLKQVFPQYPLLIDGINWAIIITIIGTLHAMMWAVSSLIVSIARKIARPISQTVSIIFVSCAIIAASIFFTSIDLLFSIAAVGIVSAYMSAMITLITYKKERTASQIWIASIGLLTAGIICICALDGIFHFI